MSSILTNNSALVALHTLKSVNSELGKTQDMISTGKEVARAKDNSAIWAISKVMESDIKGFEAISDSLSLGEATISLAAKGAEQISDTLNEIKKKIVAANADDKDHGKLQTEVTLMIEQIGDIITGSQLNGANLLDDSTSGISVLASLNRGGGTVTATHIDVASVDFISNLDLSDIDVSSKTAAQSSLAAIETHIQTAVDGAALLGAAAMRVAEQNKFVSNILDSMNLGVSALVDTDMEAASARLQALQVQQQLATQSLSIANQNPQALLALFRN